MGWSGIGIDRVEVGGKVLVRLSTLNQRTTPELWGEISNIAPDLSRDALTGAEYYSARVNLPAEERDKISADVDLVPGMPVEAYLQAGDRSVASYLLKPIFNQFENAFLEE